MNQISFCFKINILVFIILGCNLSLFGQTKISGTVTDKETKEPLAFVSIAFQNTSIGTTTELDGTFAIETDETVSNVVISYVGYEDQVFPVKNGVDQIINVKLSTGAVQLEAATVVAKKEKYSKKNNPAVDLMRKVIKGKKQSGLNGKEFYSYNSYEKVQVDLNTISEKIRKRKVFKSFDFIWDYVDSTDVNSKPFLPLLLRETNASVYYKDKPSTERTLIHGIKVSKIDKAMNQENLNQVINVLYQDIDIYENKINLLQQQFVSPLAPIAIDFYRFYIIDTVDIAGTSTTNLSFIPKNQANFGFTGNIYISNDDQYQVVKVEMGIFGNVNLNFVRDIKIEQEFQAIDSTFVLSRDKVKIDYALFEEGIGVYGTKTMNYDNYSFAPIENQEIFGGVEKVIVEKDAEEKDSLYWANNRMVPLNKNEAGVYEMIDSLGNVPQFQKLQKGVNLILSGYIPLGKITIGPYANFLGFNNVEGLKLKFGAETNPKFSKKWFLQAYAAYGTRDKVLKYAGRAYYAFNESYFTGGRHYINLNYSQETGFPGYDGEFQTDNNLLQSFRWGIRDKLLFMNTFKAEYVQESKSMEYRLSYTNIIRRPYGNLVFNYQGMDEVVDVEKIHTSELGFKFRFAPNQQFLRSGKYRTPIYNKYPIFNVAYGLGVKDVFGGEYTYHRLSASIFKQFQLSIFGRTNIEVAGGKVFGDVPYILMHIPKADQTYAYSHQEYNMMNFMEFVGEEYVNVNMRHYFNGFIFNRIPLIKRLKLREVITAKAIWGRISDEKNPALHPELIQFPINDNNESTTFGLSDKPYAELSFGISNIFKLLRIDLVQRLTYLDHPNVPQLFGNKGLGIRMLVQAEF